MNAADPLPARDEVVDVGIVGGGPAGIALGTLLRRAGMDSFTILEKNPDFGGTWYENSYPGAACDVPSHLYSFSFHLNRGWTSSHASQSEILEYLKDCARSAKLEEKTRFRFAVTDAAWDSRSRNWTVSDASGARLVFRHLVFAVGTLNHPNIPAALDFEAFGGEVFHTARWPKGLELEGRTVAVVGTGASAAQIVPAITEEAARVLVFQREPNWILPNVVRPFHPSRIRRFESIPGLARLYRWFLYWRVEARIVGLVRRGGRKTVRRQFRALEVIEQQVSDAGLRELLTPRYEIGCKRVLFAPNWFDALQRPNVELVPESVAALGERTVRTASGGEFAADVVVLSTGFKADTYLAGIRVVADGRSIHDFWADRGGPEAYLGMCVPGFPNLFLLYGPNTNLISSIFFAIECQARYVIRLLRMSRRRRWGRIEVRMQAHDAFQRVIAERLTRTVWTGTCNNYFRTAAGKIVTQWPGTSLYYWLSTKRVRRSHFT